MSTIIITNMYFMYFIILFNNFIISTEKLSSESIFENINCLKDNIVYKAFNKKDI